MSQRRKMGLVRRKDLRRTNRIKKRKIKKKRPRKTIKKGKKHKLKTENRTKETTSSLNFQKLQRKRKLPSAMETVTMKR